MDNKLFITKKNLFWPGYAGILMLAGLPVVTLAAPAQISVGLDNRFTDNARLTSGNEQSDIETTARVGIDWTSDPGRCNASVGGSLGYSVWLDSTFDPEARADLGAAGDCEIARGLIWEVSDNIRQVTDNTRNPDTPANRSTKNVFSTGPTYTLPLTRRDQLLLSARYQNTQFLEGNNDDDGQVNVNDLDSDRIIGSVSWNHLFDETTTAGINLRADRAELDNQVEIDTDTARVTFSKAWPTTQMSGAVGVSEIETTAGGVSRSSDGVVGNLSLNRQINPTADVYVDFSRELTDQTSDFDIRFGEFSFNLQETSVVEVTLLRTGLDKQFSGGSTLNLEVNTSYSDYELSDNDEERYGGSIDFTRPLVSQLDLTGGLRYSVRSFDIDDTDDEFTEVDLGLSYEASESLRLSGSVGHNRRDSDNGRREYDENWVLVGITYAFR
ncbi:MAG: outer membrane beta-barrel protein [Oleiphilaceae bacterium]|nr:outer membrane beta-barrel protein [Oleiphilaceae bacterium]